MTDGGWPGHSSQAVPARDVEQHDNPVAGLDVCDLGADFLDYSHWLVSDDVAFPHHRAEFGV